MSKGMSLADALEKEIGANDKHQAPEMWLDTGFPPLNHAISGRYDGGFPAGRICEMFGPPSAGKTAIATEVMIAAQKAGGVAMFNDHERSFDVRLGQINGLDTDPSKWIFKTPETFEKSIADSMKVAALIRNGGYIDAKAPIVMVFDSLAAMVPKSKMDKNVDEFNMNDNTALARATSAVFPALAQWCEKYNVLALFLNQARTKIGVMYGDATTTPGGNAPEFYASVRIKLGRKQLVKGTGADKRVIGNQIGAECIKNKISRPFEKATWNFVFQEDGTGKFDVTGSLVEYLIDKDIIKSSGARVLWTDGKSYFKSQLVERIESEGLQDELMALLPGRKKEAA